MLVCGSFVILLIGGLLKYEGFFVLPSPKKIQNDHKKVRSYKGVGVYYINLDRSAKRLHDVRPFIQALGFPAERISAVDGSVLKDEDLENKFDIKGFERFMGRSPLRGEIGCALSHVKAWEVFLESPYAYALILEDDIVFDPSTIQKVVKSLVHKPQLWDVCNLDIRLKGEKKGWSLHTGQVGGYGVRVFLKGVYGTDAYLIKRCAAQKMLDRAHSMALTIEDYFTRAWEFGLVYTALYPRAVHQPAVDSVIHAMPSFTKRMPLSIYERFERWLSSRFYRFKTALIRCAYGLKVGLF